MKIIKRELYVNVSDRDTSGRDVWSIYEDHHQLGEKYPAVVTGHFKTKALADKALAARHVEYMLEADGTKSRRIVNGPYKTLREAQLRLLLYKGKIGTVWATCSGCDGKGVVTAMHPWALPRIRDEFCSHCGGAGKNTGRCDCDACDPQRADLLAKFRWLSIVERYGVMTAEDLSARKDGLEAKWLRITGTSRR